MRIFGARDHKPAELLTEYNVTGQLAPFAKFGNSFISERLAYPLRAANASNYVWFLYLAKPAMVQMVRISFSVVNHLTDQRLMRNRFAIERVFTNSHRQCRLVANNSVSPWTFNSTRFDYWYFCLSKSAHDFQQEASRPTNVVQVETSSQVPIRYDMATLILAEQYSNNQNYSEPICGLPEVPVGLDSRVVNDQTKYAFACAKGFRRKDSFGGQYQLRECDFDMRWHGQLPVCSPERRCARFRLATSLVNVYKYDRVYYVNQTHWIPIQGSRAFFRCKDETNIFVGKEIRVCGEDGEWSDSLPNCLVGQQPHGK